MKRIFTFMLTVLFLFGGFSAFADVVFAPESDFLTEHRKECTYVDRNYYANSEKGYIALYKRPEGSIIAYHRNAQRLRVVYTYKDWGLVSYIGGYSREVESWVKMSDLYLIYDERSFSEEHAKEITQTAEPLTLPEGIETVLAYDYPGSEYSYPFSNNLSGVQTNTCYTDAEGRIWGKIGYYQGLRNDWICFSNPTEKIAPFGGDPVLEEFEKYTDEIELPELPNPPAEDTDPQEPIPETPEPVPDAEEPPIEEPIPSVPDSNIPEVDDTDLKVPETDDTDLKAPETESSAESSSKKDPANTQVFAPIDPPKTVPMDPMVILAIVLVAVAVLAAGILILICYKKKK